LILKAPLAQYRLRLLSYAQLGQNPSSPASGVYSQLFTLRCALNQFLTVKWNTRKMWQGNSTVIVRHVSQKGGVQSMTSMKYATKLIQNINTELSFNKWL
jgi:hypothetical protein